MFQFLFLIYFVCPYFVGNSVIVNEIKTRCDTDWPLNFSLADSWQVKLPSAPAPVYEVSPSSPVSRERREADNYITSTILLLQGQITITSSDTCLYCLEQIVLPCPQMSVVSCTFNKICLHIQHDGNYYICQSYRTHILNVKYLGTFVLDQYQYYWSGCTVTKSLTMKVYLSWIIVWFRWNSSE